MSQGTMRSNREVDGRRVGCILAAVTEANGNRQKIQPLAENEMW
jgi:hypothetical protein